MSSNRLASTGGDGSCSAQPAHATGPNATWAPLWLLLAALVLLLRRRKTQGIQDGRRGSAYPADNATTTVLIARYATMAYDGPVTANTRLDCVPPSDLPSSSG